MTIYFPFFLFVFLRVFCRWLFLFSFSVIASTWSTAWERAPGWLKSDLEVGRRGSGRPGRCSRWVPQRPWAHGKLLVILENEVGSARIGAQQLGNFGQVAAHLLDEFQLQVWKVVLQEATEVETHTGRAQGVSSLPRFSWHASCHPTCLAWLVNFLEKGLVTLLIFHF